MASASRWSTRCRSRSRSRWRAAAGSTASASPAACRSKSSRKSARSTTGAARASASGRTRDIFGKDATFRPERLFAMTRSKAYLFGGVHIRWQCDKALVEGTDVPEKAEFHFPGGLADYLAAELGERKDHRADLLGPHREGQRQWRDRMGGRLVPGRRLRPLLLQHDSDRRRRHPRSGPPRRPGQGAEGPCRSDRQQARRRDHRRRRDDLGGAHAVGLHPRAGIRRPDQGPAGQRPGDPHRRERRPRSLRPLACRLRPTRRPSCSTG